MYYFYMLRCRDNSLYSGQTNNLKRRIAEHQSGLSRSAKYTRGRGPVKLVYCEEHETATAARQRELEVKGWTKTQKEALISPCNLSL